MSEREYKMKTIRNYLGLAIKVGEVYDIPLAYLKLRRKRSEIDEEKMKELIESVKEGVIEPLIVREVDGEYEIIAGERRFLAAEKAGLISVPCRVIECSDADADKLWLVSNIQREDLPPIDIASALKDMMERYDYSVSELARVLGKSHTWVMNHLALLEYEKKLPKEFVTQMKPEHAKVLKSLEPDIREKVIEEIKEWGRMPTSKEIEDLAAEIIVSEVQEEEEKVEKEVAPTVQPISQVKEEEVGKVEEVSKPLKAEEKERKKGKTYCILCWRPISRKRLYDRLFHLERSNKRLFDLVYEGLEDWAKDEYSRYREKALGSVRE